MPVKDNAYLIPPLLNTDVPITKCDSLLINHCRALERRKHVDLMSEQEKRGASRRGCLPHRAVCIQPDLTKMPATLLSRTGAGLRTTPIEQNIEESTVGTDNEALSCVQQLARRTTRQSNRASPTSAAEFQNRPIRCWPISPTASNVRHHPTPERGLRVNDDGQHAVASNTSITKV